MMPILSYRACPAGFLTEFLQRFRHCLASHPEVRELKPHFPDWCRPACIQEVQSAAGRASWQAFGRPLHLNFYVIVYHMLKSAACQRDET